MEKFKRTAKFMREARASTGLGQAAFGRLVSYSQGAISNIEKGKRGIHGEKKIEIEKLLEKMSKV